jgi:hypothetical protein
VGVIMSFLVKIDLASSANTVLLPLAGILIGLSFAWAGNAQTIMQSHEIGKLSEYHEGGFVEYISVYQTAILTILITLGGWELAGLSIFDKQWPTTCNQLYYFGVKTILFTLASLTLRECWQVVVGARYMLLAQKIIKDAEEKGSGGK